MEQKAEEEKQKLMGLKNFAGTKTAMATDKAHGSDGGDGILGDPAAGPAKAAMSPDGEPALAKEQALSDSPVRDTWDAEGNEVDKDKVVKSNGDHTG